MEAILNSFVWGHNRHKLAWHVLKNPMSGGGCALPDVQDYYLAAQFSHMYYLNTTEAQPYRNLACDKPGHPLFTPIQTILRREPWNNKPPRYNQGMLAHHQKIWDIALKKQNMNQFHSHTPLWHNTHMPELDTAPDPTIWALYGVIYLSQVMTDTGPKTFQALKGELALPNYLLFRYLQLRHALQAQFTNHATILNTPPVF